MAGGELQHHRLLILKKSTKLPPVKSEVRVFLLIGTKVITFDAKRHPFDLVRVPDGDNNMLIHSAANSFRRVSMSIGELVSGNY